jgi:hypothetical protein
LIVFLPFDKRRAAAKRSDICLSGLFKSLSNLSRRNLTPLLPIRFFDLASLVWEAKPTAILVAKGLELLGIATRIGI